MTQRLRTKLLATYRACLNNALDLLVDAEVLLERGSYPRAYMLAFTAIEEISKSQLAADLFTGFITQEAFDRAIYNHREKIDRVLWAALWAHGVFGELPEDALLPQASDRMAALYVDIDTDDAPLAPKDRVPEEAAAAMIRTARAGLDKMEQWEALGGRWAGVLEARTARRVPARGSRHMACRAPATVHERRWIGLDLIAT